MIDPPKRTGYRLTYDAECLYNDWQEIGGCSCHTGCAPCRSCHNDGHPVSLEENDEAWELDYDIADAYNAWKLKQEVDMSRSEITDKGGSGGWVEVLPTNLNSLTVGQEVKINEVQTRITKLDMSLDKSNVIGFFTARDITVDGNPNNFWGKHSHSDTKVWVKGNTQPADYTAYVVFKQESTGIGRGTYNSKEYAYKCSRDDFTQALGYEVGEVFAEVVVNGVEKKVKVVRIEAKVDPKATKSIVRILPKELAKDVEGSKLGTPKAILEAVNFVHDFKPNDFSITKEDVNMSNVNRVVSVKFFDDDAGLKAEHALVAEYQVTTRVSDAMTVSKVLLTNDVAGDIDLHNKVRSETVDLHILKNTGNKVMLQPVEFEDLRVTVTNI